MALRISGRAYDKAECKPEANYSEAPEGGIMTSREEKLPSENE